MKTLDEVIKKCQGYVDDVAKGWDKQDCSLPYDDIMDALHYLWEYRTEQKILRDRKEHYEYWEHKYYAELEKNDPLTWDELKQMEGKPVWVEAGKFGSHWYLIEEICQNETIVCLGKFHESITLYHEDILTYWQAYRKERE